MMLAPFTDKFALITGASRGLGLEIARRFVRDGANVAISARSDEDMQTVAQELREQRISQAQRILPVAADLADDADADRLITHVLSNFGGLDILVNNAAIQGPIGRFDGNAWDQWRAVFDVNLFAAARLMQLAIPPMRARGGGKIINLSGGGAATCRPDFSAYAASKCALVRLTETIAEEAKTDRIDINAVAPGAMNTRMLDELIAAGPEAAPREHQAALERSQNGGAPPQRAAELVAWLACRASDGITGKLISAAWDDWERLAARRDQLRGDLFTLRRVT